MNKEKHINFSRFKGTLTRKPILKGSEKKYALLNIACERDYQNENGKTNSDFISVKLWKDAEQIANELNEGQLIEVKAHTRTGSYTNEIGDKIYTTDLIVDEINYSLEIETEKSKSNEDEVLEK